MNIQIRKAQKKDLPDILNLVRELAVYEKAGSEVSATLQDYEAEFVQGNFEAIVACSDHQVIGMALYYLTFSTWKGRMIYLEDFVVNSAYRKKGVGQLIFDAFLEDAKSKGAKLTKWQVLDWNQPAIDFYIKNNAVIEKEWWTVKHFY